MALVHLMYKNIRIDADELAGTENRIAVERMRCSEAVKVCNHTIKSLPANLLAGMSVLKMARSLTLPRKPKKQSRLNSSRKFNV
jgi:hypothetical protein